MVLLVAVLPVLALSLQVQWQYSQDCSSHVHQLLLEHWLLESKNIQQHSQVSIILYTTSKK